jgi:hypothetical protein
MKLNNNPSIENVRHALATMVDESTVNFPNITKDQNTSATVLGYHKGDLVLETKFYDPRLKKYLIDHVTFKIIRKHRLIDDAEIDLFEPFIPEGKEEE